MADMGFVGLFDGVIRGIRLLRFYDFATEMDLGREISIKLFKSATKKCNLKKLPRAHEHNSATELRC